MVELRHELNINLGLILTHQLDLSLKILSASMLELQEQIDELVLLNPLVDIDKDYSIAPNNYFE
ncbi:MAG: RNA polymerase sigma-54 factor, partial [Desulfurella sp.]